MLNVQDWSSCVLRAYPTSSLSDRTRHIWIIGIDGSLPRSIHTSKWIATRLHHAREISGWIYDSRIKGGFFTMSTTRGIDDMLTFLTHHLALPISISLACMHRKRIHFHPKDDSQNSREESTKWCTHFMQCSFIPNPVSCPSYALKGSINPINEEPYDPTHAHDIWG